MSEPHIRYQRKPFYGSSHSWALAILHTLPKNLRVLDIGSGSGVMGEALRAHGITDLYAVEIDASAREHVKNIYREAAADISTFQNQKFDVILLLDVLEHMVNPEEYLAVCASMLSPGGKILISLPNIAHWSVRFLLLFGKFDSAERGIMDRTHLQWFTRKRVRRMIQNTPGITRAVYDSSIEPVEFIVPEIVSNNPLFKGLSRVRHSVARALPGFFAFQHLILVER